MIMHGNLARATSLQVIFYRPLSTTLEEVVPSAKGMPTDRRRRVRGESKISAQLQKVYLSVYHGIYYIGSW